MTLTQIKALKNPLRYLSMSGYLLEVKTLDQISYVNFLFRTDYYLENNTFNKYEETPIRATLIWPKDTAREFDVKHFPKGILHCNKAGKSLTIPLAFLATVGICK